MGFEGWPLLGECAVSLPSMSEPAPMRSTHHGPGQRLCSGATPGERDAPCGLAGFPCKEWKQPPLQALCNTQRERR